MSFHHEATSPGIRDEEWLRELRRGEKEEERERKKERSATLQNERCHEIRVASVARFFAEI